MDLLARRWIWRAGRKLYMLARKEGPNDMSTDGELRLQRLVIRSIPPGSKIIAFDVGTWHGDWSKAFVDGAEGRPGGFQLHAFEPVPDSYTKLQETFAEEVGSGEVRINGRALSNESTKVLFYVPTSMSGTSTLHPESTVNYEQMIEVETTTIDRYCIENSIDHIDVIKIDTEGNDLRVMQGATELLRDGKVGLVQFEYNYRWIYSRSYLKDVFDFVRNTPYFVAKVCASALEVYVEWHPELERFFETNYALVHARLLDSLECDVFRIGFGNACELVGEIRGAGDRQKFCALSRGTTFSSFS